MGQTNDDEGSALPKQQRVALLENQGPDFTFRTTTTPLPTFGPLDLLIRLSATGVCGSDMGLASGELGPTRQILGHEGIGRIVARGSLVPPSSAPLGTRVGVAWVRDACGECGFCVHPGGETRCVSAISGRTVDGTFAEYAVVPLRYLTRVPEGVEDEALAPILCSGLTAYTAVKGCGATPGSWVGVAGAGGNVGIMAVQYARAMGYRVVGVDGGAEKGVAVREAGAEAFVDFMVEKDVPAAVKRTTTGEKGVQAMIVTANSLAAYRQALGMLAPFGTLVCVGILPPSQKMELSPTDFIANGYKVIGSAVGSRRDMEEAMEFVRRGLVRPKVQTISLEELDEVASKFKRGESGTKYVVVY